MATLPRIERSTLVEQVIARIEDLVSTGVWSIGERIPAEPELVAELGVSRNTVREAVRALVHGGLLDPRPGDGTYVRAATGLGAAVERMARHWDAVEALEVRQLLERGAAGLAAERRTDADLEAIDAALARRAQASTTQAGTAQASAAFIDADVAFHQAVIAASHNRLLISTYETFTGPLRRSIAEVLERRPEEDHGASHRALARAIRRGDRAAADRAAGAQLTEAASALTAIRSDPG